MFLLIFPIIAYYTSKNFIHKNIYKNALEIAALYDHLTHLPNRQLLSDRLYQLIESAIRYNRPFALLFLDLDGFKAVNDNLGHEAGDELLKEVGERFLNAVRKSDTVARFGGDEFIILIPEVEGEEQCETIAKKILDSLSYPFIINDKKAIVGASIGIAIYDINSRESADDIIMRADNNMYTVKETGKNSFII
jgi:diguanylate cyclase (GGDEF)-like protein